ncbi:Tether containing UBX domain for GLUT4 [Actinomortierella wolfii]|nr:Tether containing UBX domain for GLUT4 [Actinomortierella wolfii]
MSSNLTVLLGGAKKQLIKTTPTMNLREVVNQVCAKQGYPDPENYGLQNGRTVLDLSLSIRYVNIAPGTKLELIRVPKNKSAPSNVKIALQLEDGDRKVKDFPITSTLWEVLVTFEQISEGTLNITRRTGKLSSTTKNIFSLARLNKSKNPSEVYLLPVVILLEREYVTIEKLKTTTLQLAGLTSGNALMRVLMRYTDASIDDFMEEITKEYPRPGVSTCANGSTPSSPQLANSTASPRSASTPQPTALAQPADEEPSSMEIDPTPTSLTRNATAPTVSEHSQPAPFVVPLMTARSGSVMSDTREGIVLSPGASASNPNNGSIERPSAEESINTAMIEANHEIRQLREQQAQAVITDRVKRLARAQDGTDRDRFSRSISYADFTEEPAELEESQQVVASPTVETAPHAPLRAFPRSESPVSSVQSQEELVRQIARRVSQQLRSATARGDSTLDRYSLIAQEIEKEQRSGTLPISPGGSRQNSMCLPKSKSPSPPSRQDSTSSESSQPAAASRSTPLPSATLASTPVDTPSTQSSSPVIISPLDVRVFRPPADSSTPLSNQIDLPDDFYTLSSQELVQLLDSQKRAREAEENRPFKTSQMRAEEEKAREKKYPKTILRIRFPDRVQLQATFPSSTTTVKQLYEWVASTCVGQGEKFELYTTPPKKVLKDDKQTLYQAGLAPQSIVYFSWKDTKLNQHSPFLKAEYLGKMEDLPVPGGGNSEAAVEQVQVKSVTAPSSSPSSSPSTGTSEARTGSNERASSGTSVPKWLKLSKK